MIFITKQKQLGTAVMRESSYNNIQLSSNQLLTILGSELSDDLIKQLAKDEKTCFQKQIVFSSAILLGQLLIFLTETRNIP